MHWWRRLQHAPALLRWPVKWLLLGSVTFLVLYPNPALFLRHLQHVRQMDQLPNARSPALAPVQLRFNTFLAHRGVDVRDPQVLLREVNTFVRHEIPYAWDWDVWGVAEYLPSLEEVLAKRREDCDGRAVVAAALLRAQGIPAELVADSRHMWVRTPRGETMGPLGPPIIESGGGRMKVRWSGLIDLGPPAFGISVFPLHRELIIVLSLWIVLLPYRLDRRWAVLSLGLLVAGLLVIRAAGADPIHPRTGGIVLGLVAIGLPIVGLWHLRLRKPLTKRVPAELPVAQELT